MLRMPSSTDQPQWIDIHCHCLPGVDDGPPSLAAALDLCRALVLDGVIDVIATPHMLGRYEGRNAAGDIRRAVVALQAEIDRAAIPLRLHSGGEVRIDPGVGVLIQRDQILTLADKKRHALIELPHEIAVNPARLITQLAGQGIVSIIAHVERYPTVLRDPNIVIGWIQEGAALQVNAESLLGEAGAAAEACAWNLLRRGSVSLVASDAHDTARRRPRLSAVARLLAREIGATPARQLLFDNPQRVLSGEPLQPVVSFVDGSLAGEFE